MLLNSGHFLTIEVIFRCYKGNNDNIIIIKFIKFKKKEKKKEKKKVNICDNNEKRSLQNNKLWERNVTEKIVNSSR